MTTIEPDIDRYGRYARGSALADYLEMLALAGRTCTRAQLEDNVKDKYRDEWASAHVHMIVDIDDYADPSSDDATEDDGNDVELVGHIEETFECLNERVDILGERYPFQLTDDGLTLRDGVDPISDVYVAVLCLTVAHAWAIKPGVSVTDTFEEVVASALESRSVRVARMGELARRKDFPFPKVIVAAGDEMGIPCDPEAAPYKRHANDGGVDVLAHFSWWDRRLGRWTFVGQVTCGQSESWKKKMGEAAPGRWMRHFQEVISPQGFLAIPHHAPRRTFDYVVTDEEKLLLDRLRIVMARTSVSSDEATIIQAVLAIPVDDVAAA